MQKLKNCLEYIGNGQYKVVQAFKLGSVTMNAGIVIRKGIKISGIDPTDHLEDTVE